MTRSTLRIHGTVADRLARLDHASDLAVEWARKHLRAGPLGLDPTQSGVVRRALAVYVQHLGSADPEAEAREVHRCCSALMPDEATRKAAWARLEASEAGTHPAPFADVLRGGNWRADAEAFDARAEELFLSCRTERRKCGRPVSAGACGTKKGPRK